MGGGVLFPGAAFQLSALHGHGLSRVPHAHEISEIPDLYRACRIAAGAGRSDCPRLVSAASLDFHFVHLLEPVALHGSKFWADDDVCAAFGARAESGGAYCDSFVVYRVISFVDVEFSYGIL